MSQTNDKQTDKQTHIRTIVILFIINNLLFYSYLIFILKVTKKIFIQKIEKIASIIFEFIVKHSIGITVMLHSIYIEYKNLS